MKTITIEIPEGKRAEWVDGVLTLVDDTPKDITERIKTFEDARLWCELNRQDVLIRQYDALCSTLNYMKVQGCDGDILAYLKLRIITCALNEGWEPTIEKGDERYEPYWENEEELSILPSTYNVRNYPIRLSFKTEEICKYAATRFKDIYMDFCKGKE